MNRSEKFDNSTKIRFILLTIHNPRSSENVCPKRFAYPRHTRRLFLRHRHRTRPPFSAAIQTPYPDLPARQRRIPVCRCGGRQLVPRGGEGARPRRFRRWCSPIPAYQRRRRTDCQSGEPYGQTDRLGLYRRTRARQLRPRFARFERPNLRAASRRRLPARRRPRTRAARA